MELDDLFSIFTEFTHEENDDSLRHWIAKIEETTAIIAQDPKNAAPYNIRGFAKWRMGEHKTALEDLTKAIELKPDYSEALTNMGMVKRDMGLLDEAIADLQKARKFDKTNHVAFFAEGVAKNDQGKHAGAIQCFCEALAIKPNHAESFFGRAVAKMALKEYQSALDDLNNSILSDDTYLNAYRTRGILLFEHLHEPEKALQDLDTVISRAKTNARAYFHRGDVKLNFGLHDEALTDVSKAIDLDPYFAKSYFLMGVIYQEKNNSPAALVYLDRAIALDADYAKAFFVRGVIKTEQGLREGIADLRKSLDLGLEPEKASKAKAIIESQAPLYDLISQAFNSKQDEEKREAYKKVVSLPGGHALISKMKDVFEDYFKSFFDVSFGCDYHFNLGEFAKAISLAEEAIALNPDDEKLKKRLRNIEHAIKTRDSKFNSRF